MNQEGYQADEDIKTAPPQGSAIKAIKTRKDTLLEDMYKLLEAQREKNEELYKLKRARQVLEHEANVKEAHYLATVANDYPTKETRAAAAQGYLEEDEGHKEIRSQIDAVDEEIFTAKLDLDGFLGEWKILVVESQLIGTGNGCQCQ
jgi:phage-related protein